MEKVSPPPRKLRFPQWVKSFRAFYETKNFFTPFTRVRQIYPMHMLLSPFFMLLFNIVLLYKPGSSQTVSLSRVPHQNNVHTSQCHWLLLACDGFLPTLGKALANVFWLCSASFGCATVGRRNLQSALCRDCFPTFDEEDVLLAAEDLLHLQRSCILPDKTH